MRRLVTFFGIFVLSFLSFAEANAQDRKSVSGAEVTGIFRDESNSELKISALGKGKLRVAFSGVYEFKMANGEDMANVGEASGTATIVGDTATFTPEETEQCTITMKFLTRGRLKVTQAGTDAECGFGHNVNAEGLYKKISSKKPKFEQTR